jgi:hypothetical protein
MQHNLEDSSKVQGLVKPGSDMASVINTVTKYIEELTSKNVVVV